MPKLILLLFLVAIAFVAPHFLRATAVPAVGATAPDFTLTSQHGKPVTLSQYRGKWVALYFCPEDVTGADPAGATELRARPAEVRRRQCGCARGSVQNVNSSQQLAGDESAAFQLLSDPEKKVIEKYGSVDNFAIGTTAARSNFLINPQGRIMDEFVGVDPGKHSQQVLAKLAGQESK